MNKDQERYNELELCNGLDLIDDNEEDDLDMNAFRQIMVIITFFIKIKTKF